MTAQAHQANHKKTPCVTGRDWLVDYFTKLEEALVLQSEVATLGQRNETGTGQNREHLVARFLEEHLPRLAAISIGGKVIDADTCCHASQPEDVLVVNPFVPIGAAFPAGWFPVESVYCAIQVKSSWNDLRSGVLQASATKKLLKAIRPETLYYGFMTKEGQVPDLANRKRRADTGVWIWRTDFPKDEASVRQALVDKISCAVKDTDGHSPSFIYVPGRLLAFKTYPNMDAHQKSLFPFTEESENLQWSADFAYCFYEPKKSSKPSRLQVLLFWLAQGILQFIHEVPDLMLYAFPKNACVGRQGYCASGVWHPLCYESKDGKNPQWVAHPRPPEPVAINATQDIEI